MSLVDPVTRATPAKPQLFASTKTEDYTRANHLRASSDAISSLPQYGQLARVLTLILRLAAHPGQWIPTKGLFSGRPARSEPLAGILSDSRKALLEAS